MPLSKQDILNATNNGLSVFRHYMPGDWRLGKSFLNPFYQDTKAACHVYLDRASNTYKIKDFGEADFAGDCFFLVAFLHNKDCSNKSDFMEVLKIIDADLRLGLNEYSAPRPLPKAHNFQDKPNKPVSALVETQENVSNTFKAPTFQAFTEADISYWQQYGISKEILLQYGVASVARFEGTNKEGHAYQLVSSAQEPMFAYPGKRFIKLYRPNSKLRFLYAGELSDSYVFGLEQLPARGDILFITGGEKDVMSLAAKGFNAICFNSETANIPKKIIKRLNFRFKHITLLYDADKTGKEAADRHQKALKDFDVQVISLPLAGTKTEKDISDYFKLGHTRDQLKNLFCNLLDIVYEETMSILKSCEIDFKNPPVKPDALIRINNVTVGAPGNILCITGMEGSGKTNYLGGLISGVLRATGDMIDTLGTEVKNNPQGKAVIVYDTEQSEDQLYKNLSFILKRANLEHPPKWFKAYCLVGMSRKERMQVIFQSMDRFYYEHNGIHMMVIDGIADLISAVNDEGQSVELVDELFRLAGIYKTVAVCVLHLSPSGMKLRGHLGSEIQRKAAGILSVEKDENNNVSVVKALKVRDGSPLDVPLIQFGWDKELNRHIYLGEKSKEEKETRKLEDLDTLARDLFSSKGSYTYQELTYAIMEMLYVKDRQAKNYIKLMKDHGIIEKSGPNSTEFRRISAPF